MRGFAEIKRWVMHPAVSFASNVQFIAVMALGFAGLAAGFVGGTLAVLTAFPFVWLVLCAVGAFLTTAGLLGVFLPRALRNTAPPPPSAGIAVGSAPVSPFLLAAELQRNHDNAKLRRRSARRLISEELRDNRHILDIYEPGGPARIGTFSYNAWGANRDVLLDDDRPEPFAVASAAYRRLENLPLATPLGLSGHKIREAIDAIDAAIEELAAEPT